MPSFLDHHDSTHDMASEIPDEIEVHYADPEIITSTRANVIFVGIWSGTRDGVPHKVGYLGITKKEGNISFHVGHSADDFRRLAANAIKMANLLDNRSKLN